MADPFDEPRAVPGEHPERPAPDAEASKNNSERESDFSEHAEEISKPESSESSESTESSHTSSSDESSSSEHEHEVEEEAHAEEEARSEGESPAASPEPTPEPAPEAEAETAPEPPAEPPAEPEPEETSDTSSADSEHKELDETERELADEIERLRKELQAERVLRAKVVVERNMLSERMDVMTADLSQERTLGHTLKTAQLPRRPASLMGSSPHAARVATSPGDAPKRPIAPERFSPVRQPGSRATGEALDGPGADAKPESAKIQYLKESLDELTVNLGHKEDEIAAFKRSHAATMAHLNEEAAALRDDLRHMRVMSRAPEKKLKAIERSFDLKVRRLVDVKVRESNEQLDELRRIGVYLRSHFERLLTKFRAYERAVQPDAASALVGMDEIVEFFDVFKASVDPLMRETLVTKARALYADLFPPEEEAPPAHSRTASHVSERATPPSARAEWGTRTISPPPQQFPKNSPAYWKSRTTKPVVSDDANYMRSISVHQPRVCDPQKVRERNAAISRKREAERRAEREGIRRRKNIFFSRSATSSDSTKQPRVWKKFEERTDIDAPKSIPKTRRYVKGVLPEPPAAYERIFDKAELDTVAVREAVFMLPALPEV